MPPKKDKPVAAKKDFETEVLRLPSDVIRVSNEKQAPIVAMHFLIISDINYRRASNLSDLLDKADTDKLLSGLTGKITSETSKLIDDYCYLYNIKLIASLKSRELEIKDGLKCRSCGKLSGIMVNRQLRAGDEGTGRILQCTNSNCKAVQKIDSG